MVWQLVTSFIFLSFLVFLFCLSMPDTSVTLKAIHELHLEPGQYAFFTVDTLLSKLVEEDLTDTYEGNIYI